jgi:hypothetical protein
LMTSKSRLVLSNSSVCFSPSNVEIWAFSESAVCCACYWMDSFSAIQVSSCVCKEVSVSSSTSIYLYRSSLFSFEVSNWLCRDDFSL